ncbi:MAG: hypothetical protein JST11_31780, partial [Acidobacteria bacterium]|nr:hypothetical protein [Acidobacteriota bacterium]
KTYRNSINARIARDQRIPTGTSVRGTDTFFQHFGNPESADTVVILHVATEYVDKLTNGTSSFSQDVTLPVNKGNPLFLKLAFTCVNRPPPPPSPAFLVHLNGFSPYCQSRDDLFTALHAKGFQPDGERFILRPINSHARMQCTFTASKVPDGFEAGSIPLPMPDFPGWHVSYNVTPLPHGDTRPTSGITKTRVSQVMNQAMLEDNEYVKSTRARLNVKIISRPPAASSDDTQPKAPRHVAQGPSGGNTERPPAAGHDPAHGGTATNTDAAPDASGAAAGGDVNALDERDEDAMSEGVPGAPDPADVRAASAPHADHAESDNMDAGERNGGLEGGRTPPDASPSATPHSGDAKRVRTDRGAATPSESGSSSQSLPQSTTKPGERPQGPPRVGAAKTTAKEPSEAALIDKPAATMSAASIAACAASEAHKEKGGGGGQSH